MRSNTTPFFDECLAAHLAGYGTNYQWRRWPGDHSLADAHPNQTLDTRCLERPLLSLRVRASDPKRLNAFFEKSGNIVSDPHGTRLITMIPCRTPNRHPLPRWARVNSRYCCYTTPTPERGTPVGTPLLRSDPSAVPQGARGLTERHECPTP